MKRKLLKRLPEFVPEEISRLADGCSVYDSSCSKEAKVYFIDKNGGYFLKKANKGLLEREAVLTEYFRSKGLSADVLNYISDEYDWLLTSALPGEDCISEKYLADPARLCDTIAEELRKLHQTDCGDCPVEDRTGEYLRFAEENYKSGNYDKSAFPDSFGYRNAEDAYKVLQQGKGMLKNTVLLHGDYCLPNILLKDWGFSGFIDLGKGGKGDRHIDVFWGIWTLSYNLKTNGYRERFPDAYGRDKIDESVLEIIAAAEVFG